MQKLWIPVRYVPSTITKKDAKAQTKMLLKSRKLYKKRVYFTRRKIPSYKNKPSKHVQKAREIYGVQNVMPSKELSKKTGCSISALQQIVKKGEGAYYSSGSRPNQTAHSWGYARLASALTSGKSAAVDFSILEKGCDHKKRAYRMALQSRKKYKNGHSHTKRIKINT
jgi:hypothetical protein